MRDSGVSYAAWALEQSRKHRDTLSSQPLTAELMAQLDAAATASLQAQADLEAADNVDFDTFLAQYLAQ